MITIILIWKINERVKKCGFNNVAFAKFKKFSILFFYCIAYCRVVVEKENWKKSGGLNLHKRQYQQYMYTSVHFVCYFIYIRYVSRWKYVQYSQLSWIILYTCIFRILFSKCGFVFPIHIHIQICSPYSAYCWPLNICTWPPK